ncbi:MAG: hypothetical protein E6G51_11390 [Actinobacteria bacterium]|nr:MAG: hypothetical protein E6G51_11390 [Actinomycetota bacterium]
MGSSFSRQTSGARYFNARFPARRGARRCGGRALRGGRSGVRLRPGPGGRRATARLGGGCGCGPGGRSGA